MAGCTEIDTLIGSIGGKIIMTFQFVNVDFMFEISLDDKTSTESGRGKKCKEVNAENPCDCKALSGKWRNLETVRKRAFFPKKMTRKENGENEQRTNKRFCQ